MGCHELGIVVHLALFLVSPLYISFIFQEAFETYKQDAISKLRARQKRVALASKERTLQDMLEKERNRLFAEEKRRKEANPEAHPLSGMIIETIC